MKYLVRSCAVALAFLGARYVREFVEEVKASGFVARALERHRIQGAAVAPAGDPK
jgi:hypothetical protein